MLESVAAVVAASLHCGSESRQRAASSEDPRRQTIGCARRRVFTAHLERANQRILREQPLRMLRAEGSKQLEGFTLKTLGTRIVTDVEIDGAHGSVDGAACHRILGEVAAALVRERRERPAIDAAARAGRTGVDDRKQFLVEAI